MERKWPENNLQKRKRLMATAILIPEKFPQAPAPHHQPRYTMATATALLTRVHGRALNVMRFLMRNTIVATTMRNATPKARASYLDPYNHYPQGPEPFRFKLTSATPPASQNSEKFSFRPARAGLLFGRFLR
jgi:hypothetical protein